MWLFTMGPVLPVAKTKTDWKIWFCGKQIGNKVFFKQRSLKFEDISISANIQNQIPYNWSSGVTILDNTDGKNDIYICNTFLRKQK
jgi:hypothetical protein